MNFPQIAKVSYGIDLLIFRPSTLVGMTLNAAIGAGEELWAATATATNAVSELAESLPGRFWAALNFQVPPRNS